MDRHIRPVGEAYRLLVTGWSEVLPRESIFHAVSAA
jgi:hypothetical protein